MKDKILTLNITQLMMASSEKTPIDESLRTYILWGIVLSPIAFIANKLGLWYEDNQIFFIGFIGTMTANVAVGMIKNLMKGTFRWWDMIRKTMVMVAAIMAVYAVLEAMRYTAGENIAGEVFRAFIQITVLMWPASKVLKNVYILTGGEFPPEFMMKKLYNFQENGDLQELFKTSGGNGGRRHSSNNDDWVRCDEEENGIPQRRSDHDDRASRSDDNNKRSGGSIKW